MRIEQLTFTRFIAAICIVIFHFGRNCHLFYNSFTGFIFKQANIGVSFFFILSGFVMIIAYNNNSKIDTFEYIKNRFARIYPVYLLSIFLILIHSILRKEIDFQGLFLSVLMIQSWLPGKALIFNYPGWSLSVESFFYIIFPFLFNSFYKKKKLKTITISILAFWLISQITLHLMIPTNPFREFPLSSEDLYYFPFMHLNEFLIGNLAGLYLLNKSENQRNYDWQILAVFFILILALKFPFGLIYQNGMLAFLFIPLILLISLNVGKLTAFFSNKICIFLGEISFGIYILQFPVWFWISDYRLKKYFQIDKIDDSTFAFFIRLFVLILISSLSFKFFETPMRKKIKKLQTKKIFS